MKNRCFFLAMALLLATTLLCAVIILVNPHTPATYTSTDVVIENAQAMLTDHANQVKIYENSKDSNDPNDVSKADVARCWANNIAFQYNTLIHENKANFGEKLPDGLIESLEWIY